MAFYSYGHIIKQKAKKYIILNYIFSYTFTVRNYHIFKRFLRIWPAKFPKVDFIDTEIVLLISKQSTTRGWPYLRYL